MKTFSLSSLGAPLVLVALLSAALPAQLVTVTGTVHNTLGLPLAGIDVEFSNGATPPLVPTTNALGIWSAIIPLGTYDISYLPATTNIAPRLVKNVTLSFPTTNVGIVVLQPGFPLSGTVTNSLGVGLFNANIDVFDIVNGGKLFTPDDVTDLFGNYLVVVPGGIFKVRAKPPPGMPLVATEATNIVVAGATSVPTLVLVPGFTLFGTVLASNTSLPLVDVDLDAFDSVTGQKLVTPGDNTDANGNFSILLPLGNFRITFEPLPGVLYASREVLNVQIAGATSMGIVTLDPGFTLSGQALGPAGPVVDADIDVDTVLGGIRLLTPGDKTDANGQFTVVVPLGTYTVTYQPKFAQSIVGASVTPIVVTGPTIMPPVTLQAGVVLSGTLTSFNGVSPEIDADIDVVNPTTGVEIETPSDNTNALGNFQVIVPVGTWDIRIQTAPLSLSQDHTWTGISVAGPTIFNRTLGLVPVGAFLGPAGLPPQTVGSILPLTFAFFRPLATARPANFSLVIIDPADVEVTLAGPVTVTVPGLQLFLLSIPFPVPPRNPAHAGLPFKLRFLITDPVTGVEFDRHEIEFVIL